MSAATAPGQLESAPLGPRQQGGLRPPDAGRVDQDPLRAVHCLDADPICDHHPRADGAVQLAHGRELERPARTERDARILADPVGFIFGAGIGLGQLTICVLGVLLMSTEYSTGVIRASLLAVPKRLPMLAAKLAVFGVLMLVLAEIVAFGSFFVGSALLHSKVAVALSDSGVLRATLGAGLYLTVLGLFAIGVGALLRHTAGAISTVIGIVLVVPILASLLPGNWGAHVNAYLPEQAGSLIFAVHQTSDQLLSAWEGFGVLCIWTLLVLGAAAYLLDRRDA